MIPIELSVERTQQRVPGLGWRWLVTMTKILFSIAAARSSQKDTFWLPHIVSTGECEMKSVWSIFGILTSAFLNFSSSFVRVGEYDLSSNSDANHVDIKIANFKRHENYNPKTKVRDIAVLTLEKDIEFSDIIAPICLPLEEPFRSEKHIKTSPYIAGWGKARFFFYILIEILIETHDGLQEKLTMMALGQTFCKRPESLLNRTKDVKRASKRWTKDSWRVQNNLMIQSCARDSGEFLLESPSQ